MDDNNDNINHYDELIDQERQILHKNIICFCMNVCLMLKIWILVSTNFNINNNFIIIVIVIELTITGFPILFE